MEEIRCASMALAASLDSSEDHRPTVKILSCLITVVNICTPQRQRENPRNPIRINLNQRPTSLLTLLRLQRPNKHPIRLKQITNRRSLRQKLWVRKDIKPTIGLRVRFQDRPHRLGRAARHSRFLNDDLGRVGNGGDASRCQFHVTYKIHR